MRRCVLVVLLSLLVRCAVAQGFYFEPVVYNDGTNCCYANLNNNPGFGSVSSCIPPGGHFSWAQQHPNNSYGSWAIYTWTGCTDKNGNMLPTGTLVAGPIGPNYSTPDQDLGALVAHVYGGGVHTNCMYTVQIANNSAYNRGYGIFCSESQYAPGGGFTGIIVYVYAGQTLPFQFPDSGCCPTCWSYQSMNGQYVAFQSGMGLTNVPQGIIYSGVYAPPGTTDQEYYQFGGNQTGLNMSNNANGSYSTNLSLGSGGTNGAMPFTNVDNQQSFVPNYTNLSGAIVAGNNNLSGNINQGFTGLDGLVSNLLSSVNRLPTNGSGGGGTNIISITNLPDTNSLGELAAISNYTLAAVPSNVYAFATNLLNTNDITPYVSTNAGNVAGNAAMAGVNAIGTALAAGQSGQDSPVGDVTMSVSIPGVGSVDLNPFHLASLATLAGWIKLCFKWLLTWGFVWAAWVCLEQYLVGQGNARQASTAGTTIVGVNVNAASALAAAAVITVALAAVPVVFVSFMASGNYVATLIVSPFASSIPSVVTTAQLINNVFPIDFAFYTSIGLLIYRISVGSLYFVSTAIVRFCVGL